MRKIFLFMMVSLDGFFEGKDHDLNWHNVDDEFNEFAVEQTKSVDTIIFGRKTYEMMAEFWPSDFALKTDPIMSGLMSNTPKLVISSTLNKADWSNTELINNDISGVITKLKNRPGKDLAVYGSSELSVSLIKLKLLDEIRIMINPVVISEGKALFDGIDQQLNLKLTGNRSFKSGNVLLNYEVK